MRARCSTRAAIPPSRWNAGSTAAPSGRAMVPSGASTGTREALELRDGGKRYGGKGVLRAAANVHEPIAAALAGRDARAQADVDRVLIELDCDSRQEPPGRQRHARRLAGGGARGRGRVGAAALRLPRRRAGHGPAGAAPQRAQRRRPRRQLGRRAGVHAGAGGLAELLRGAARGRRGLPRAQGGAQAAGPEHGVGDEGGFAPDLESNQQALDLLVEAIGAAGYRPGADVALALDVAASELRENERDAATARYALAGEGRKGLSADDLIELYRRWVDAYPLVSIEDGLDEADWDGWKRLTDCAREQGAARRRRPLRHQSRDPRARDRAGLANALLVKVNQIGTLTETLAAMDLARNNGYRNIVSHRSGETEDTTIADLAVATRRADQDRSAGAQRARRQVQPPARDRGGAGGRGVLSGTRRVREAKRRESLPPAPRAPIDEPIDATGARSRAIRTSMPASWDPGARRVRSGRRADRGGGRARAAAPALRPAPSWRPSSTALRQSLPCESRSAAR